MTAVPAVDLAEMWVVSFTLVLARVSAFVITFPLFGQRYLPRLVKVGLCLTLTIVWLPTYVSARSMALDSWVQYAISMTGELFVGALIGYTFGLLLLPMRLAGTYVGQEMGYHLGGITDPGSQSSSNETGVIFESLGILLLLGLNVHHAVLWTLYASLAVVQLDRGFAFAGAQIYSRALSQMHEASFLLIAPLATSLFTVLVVLAILMRVWPQINLFSFGIAVRLGLGLIAVTIFLPHVISNLQRFLASAIEEMPLYVLGL